MYFIQIKVLNTEGMIELIKKLGIVRTTSIARTLERNGVAERFNLELEKKNSTNLESAGMSNGFWNLYLDYAMYVHNKSPKTEILEESLSVQETEDLL